MLVDCCGPALCSAVWDIFKLTRAHPPPRHLLLPSQPTPRLLCAMQLISSILFLSRTCTREKDTERKKWRERKESYSNPVLPISQLDEEITQSGFWAECCLICWLGMWTPSGALRSFFGHSPPLPFVPLFQLSLSVRLVGIKPVRWLLIMPSPLFTVHSPFLFALLNGLALTYFQGSHALFPLYVPLPLPLFFLLLRALFVNVQRRRMREQIMKHRSAFHTLFRKNSPTAQRGRGATSPCDSTPTFGPYGSFYVCGL